MIDPTTLIDTTKHAMSAPIDTAVSAISHAGGGQEETLDFGRLLEHMHNAPEIDIPGGHIVLPQFAPIHLGALTIDLSISKHVFFMLIAAILVILFSVWAARSNMKKKVPSGLGNLFEIFIVFMRDEVAMPNMGPRGMRYLPYLLTTFFFILIMNLLGLVPYGATSTANISVTAALAFLAFVMIQFAAIREQGLKHFLTHLTGGVHWSLWPIMIPVEILGLFTKPFALCMRLFANMNGGHIVLLALVGLILLFRSFIIAPLPVLFGVGVLMLEIFVALLQAYIFVMLTSLFMGLGMQSEHEEEHEEHVHS